MPFGLVTKTYLERRVTELRKEIEAAEWDAKQWYAKFRALYARMMRAGEKAGDEATGTDAKPLAAAGPSAPLPFPRERSRRGF
jgi:hypothetical protein